MTSRTVRKIGVLVNTSEVKELVMGYCKFTATDIEMLQESLGRCKVFKNSTMLLTHPGRIDCVTYLLLLKNI